MRSISIELVPRSYEGLEAEIDSIKKEFARIDTLNIPDLLNCSIRSWEACLRNDGRFRTAIPHIRSIDFDLNSSFELGGLLQKNNINSILAVTGDPPQDTSRTVYDNTSIDLIKAVKKEYPSMKVYAAIDPYRYSLRDELNIIKRKLDAGADGFFTQPFFDVRLLELYMEQMDGISVYWGISPVTTENSKRYWEKRNNVVFPRSYKLDIDSNAEVAKQIMKSADSHGSSVYFMPIKVDPVEYLRKVFG